MRRTSKLAAAAAASVLLLTAGCGDDDAGPPLLMLASTSGTAIVDGASGELQQLARGAASTPDGTVLFETITAGPDATTVTAHVVATRTQRWTANVHGAHEARVVNATGTAVVLGPPRGGEVLLPGALAPGRTETTLVVVNEGGAVEELDVPGNIEPEAFSLDGDALFVVDYQPPEAPTHYQVQRLDLASGELGDVFSVDAELQQSMRGTARTQVWDPDGDRLYTLYTLDPAADAPGPNTRAAADPHTGTAFVHVLDLDEQWAHCVDLPLGIGASSAGLALSEDGRSLYVADAFGGGIAEVDTAELVVTDEGALPPASIGDPSVVALDGRQLFVGSGSEIQVVDRSSLEVVDELHTTGPILGLQAGDELFVALAGSVAVLDPDTGELLRTIPVDLGDGVVLSLGASSIPTYVGVKCAC